MYYIHVMCYVHAVDIRETCACVCVSIPFSSEVGEIHIPINNYICMNECMYV